MKKAALDKHTPPQDPQDPQEMEEYCRQYGHLMVSLFGGYCLLGILLAAFTPNDILSYSWANKLIGITASVVPTFMDVPARSPIPDVVRFYFGVMWLLLPAFIIGIVYDTYNIPVLCMARPKVVEMQKSRMNAIFVCVIASLFVLIWIYLSVVSNVYQPEDGKTTRMLFSSRFSLAIGATLYNLVFLFFFGAMVILVRSLFHSWQQLPWFYKKAE